MQRDQRGDPPRGTRGGRVAAWLACVALVAAVACELIFLLPVLSSYRPPAPFAVLLDIGVAILAMGGAYGCLVHRDLRARALDLERLSAAGQAVLSCVDPHLLARTITHAAQQLSGADRAVLFQVGGQTEFLRIVSSTGTTREDNPETVIGALAVTKRQLVWTADMPADRRLSLSQDARERARRQSLRACLAVPILTEGGDVFGTLTLCYEKSRTFTDRDERLLGAYGIQAGAALEKAHALEQLALSARGDRLLRDFFERLLDASTEATVLDEAARVAHELLHADYADVLLRVGDTGELRVEAACGWEPGALDRATVPMTADSIAGHAMKRNETIQVDDWSREHVLALPSYLAAHAVRAAIVAPLTVAGEVGGVLGVYYRTCRDTTDEERRALTRLADHVALALSKSRRDGTRAPHVAGREEMPAPPVEADKLAVVAALLSRMAHELNNPLTSILLSAQVGKQQATEGELVRRRMDAIEQESKRAAKIVKDLLGVVRRRAPALSTTDVNEAIRTALRAHAPAFDLDGIRVEADLQSLPTISADASQLQQALSNLFANAAHAMKSAHGKGTLIVRSFVAGSELRAEVQDDGPGIPRELLGRIFEPFFTTKPAGEGTGLGLNVTSGIVEAHGGRMEVENVPAGGARFTIRLPLAERAPSAAPAPPVETAARRSTRIFVVDDEESLRDIVTEILTVAGHEVATAGTGREATEILARDRFDVVILDLRLPDLDGKAIWQWLVARNDTHRSRIVFMTGDVVSADTAGFLRGTGRPVLSKPATIERVYAAVDGVIAANGRAPALAAP